MLSPYMLYIKVGLIALLIAGASYGTWYNTKNHYLAIANQEQVKRDQASAKLIAEKDAKIKQGDEQYAKDQTYITFLRTESGSVQIHIPAVSCGNTQSSPDTSATSRLLSDRVDKAFRNLQEGVSGLIQQADQLNIDAIKSNTANK